MGMRTFVVAHGSLKTGRDEYITVGNSVELDEEWVAAADPMGQTFVTQEKWLAMEELEELERTIATMSIEEKNDAVKQVVKKKKAPAPAEVA